MARRQLGHAGEGGGRRHIRPVRDDLGQRCRVGRERRAGKRLERLDLGGEQQPAVVLGHEQRTDAEAVAGQEQRALPVVPQREGELAVEAVQTGGTPLQPRVEDDFGIAVRAEDAAAGFEFVTQLEIIEDLAVERQVAVAADIGHRLMALGQVDDAQASVPQEQRVVAPGAERVGPAVPQHADHAPRRRLGQVERAGQRQRSTDATHACPPFAPGFGATAPGKLVATPARKPEETAAMPGPESRAVGSRRRVAAGAAA